MDIILDDRFKLDLSKSKRNLSELLESYKGLNNTEEIRSRLREDIIQLLKDLDLYDGYFIRFSVNKINSDIKITANNYETYDIFNKLLKG